MARSSAGQVYQLARSSPSPSSTYFSMGHVILYMNHVDMRVQVQNLDMRLKLGARAYQQERNDQRKRAN